jgi:molecular chaperone GrpE
VNGNLSTIDRNAILHRVEQWLDEVLSGEDPPDGVDAELLATLTAASGDQVRSRAYGGDAEGEDARGAIDAYALWAAMTTLAHEVKLQGRAFKELHTTLEAQAAAAAEEIRRTHRERERDTRRETERRCRREMLGALVDMRDRLERGVDSVHVAAAALARRPGRLARLLQRSAPDGAETLAALVKGYELGLERLDQLLDDLRAHRIRCEGEAFDPRRMNAIDRDETTVVPPGTVVEVYRSGYEWEGEVFRPAQVKVSCAPADGTDDE